MKRYEYFPASPFCDPDRQPKYVFLNDSQVERHPYGLTWKDPETGFIYLVYPA